MGPTKINFYSPLIFLKLKNHKIILASGSPRRQQFFKDLDLDFEIRLKDIEEISDFVAEVVYDQPLVTLLEKNIH